MKTFRRKDKANVSGLASSNNDRRSVLSKDSANGDEVNAGFTVGDKDDNIS